MSRILRSLVCMLLICCILVNLSPLKTHAMELMTAGFATVSVAVAVACAMQALGVMSASNSSGFTTTVDNCTNWVTQNTDLVVNGTVALLGLTQDGVTTSYLSKNFVQTVWEWLYSSKTVQKQEVQLETTYYPSSDMLAIAMAAPYSVLVYYTINATSQIRFFYLCYSNYPITVRPNNTSTGAGMYIASTQSKGAIYYATRNDTSFNTAYGVAVQGANDRIVSVQRLGSSDPISYQTSEELSLGTIQSPYQSTETEEETIQIEIAPIYIDWTKYGVPDPNNPETPPEDDPAYRHWLPTGIPSVNFDDSVITQTQQQAQSGTVTGDLSFTPSGSNSGTGNDSGDNTGTNSGNTGSTWKPPSDPTHFKLVDLSKFFPFCIPFDLFDFFKLLNADPVAPSFTWEIQDLSGQSYGLTVDLSQWDSVAQLFRRLQLFLFVCGLAAASRKYIKW